MPRAKSRAKGESSVELGRHRELLRDSKVRSWYEETSLRSRLSADSNVRKLGLLLERLDLTTAGLIRLAREHPDELRTRFVRYAAQQKSAGRLDTYILKMFDGARSFLHANGVRFDGFPKLSPTRGASLETERVPTQEELGRVLERLSLRGRAIALLMAHSGVRQGVLGSYGGERGLVLADLKDLELSGAKPSFRELPFVIRVRAELSKTRRAYTTFGTAQLASVLVAYLESREADGEKLGPNSPVVAARESRGAARVSRDKAAFGKGFLTPKAISFELRRALNASKPSTEMRWRPYVLRAYCSTRLLLAEGDGKCTPAFREAILGHDGGVAGRYHTSKPWGAELLAEARREYAAASEFLETNGSTKTDVRRELVESLVRAVEESTGGKVGSKSTMTAEQLIDALKRSLGAKASLAGAQVAETTPQVPPSPRTVQKAVPPSELDGLLQTGWSYRGTVAAGTPGERVVVELRQ
jgi:hypothetical protein